jgi:transcriptional regulator with XRE-family HTH domain
MPEIRSPGERGSLGQYLWDLRHATGLTLREVEEAAEARVSNAYVSQLETGKITRASPAILHCLAEVYAARLPASGGEAQCFEKMMALAGHLHNEPTKPGARRGRLPTFEKEKLSDDEEDELLKYLAFLRMRRGHK